MIIIAVVHPDRLEFDGNAALALQIHLVKQLVLHIPFAHSVGNFQKPVSEGAFPVIDVCYYTKISDVRLGHK